jgi:hypothetical protein
VSTLKETVITPPKSARKDTIAQPANQESLSNTTAFPVADKKLAFFDRLENKKFGVRVFSFMISIIFTSVSLPFAVFTQNYFLMALITGLGTITLVFSILSESLKLILLLSALIFCLSIITVMYELITHFDLLKRYL